MDVISFSRELLNVRKVVLGKRIPITFSMDTKMHLQFASSLFSVKLLQLTHLILTTVSGRRDSTIRVA